MNYIPQYPISTHSQANQNWGMQNLVQTVDDLYRTRISMNRMREKEIFDALGGLKYSDLVKDRNTKLASDSINKIYDELKNAYMYEMDDDGTYTSKKKTFAFGPKLNDREYATIMNKISNIDQLISQRLSEEKILEADEKLYKEDQRNGTGLYDEEEYKMNVRHYELSGLMPEGGSFLSPKAKDPLAVVSDKKLDIRTTQLKQPEVVPSGVYDIKRYPSMNEDLQSAIYSDIVARDVGFQKGLVDKMASEEDIDSFKARIMGAIDYYDPNNPEAVRKASMEAERIMDDYFSLRKFEPDLVEAAATWGQVVKGYHKKIGEGYDVKSINQSRYKDALEKIQGEEENQQLPEGKYKFAGQTYDNYTDASTVGSEYVTLRAFKPKKGEMTKFVQKRDEEGKIIPIKGMDAIRINNPKESRMEGDYVVAGWDRDANIIRLVRKDRKGLFDEREKTTDEESYIIPYVGNESIIDEIVKKQQGNTKYTETTKKYQKYKR